MRQCWLPAAGGRLASFAGASFTSSAPFAPLAWMSALDSTADSAIPDATPFVSEGLASSSTALAAEIFSAFTSLSSCFLYLCAAGDVYYNRITHCHTVHSWVGTPHCPLVYPTSDRSNKDLEWQSRSCRSNKFDVEGTMYVAIMKLIIMINSLDIHAFAYWRVWSLPKSSQTWAAESLREIIGSSRCTYCHWPWWAAPYVNWCTAQLSWISAVLLFIC